VPNGLTKTITKTFEVFIIVIVHQLATDLGRYVLQEKELENSPFVSACREVFSCILGPTLNKIINVQISR
jgi:hypothetical protein